MQQDSQEYVTITWYNNWPHLQCYNFKHYTETILASFLNVFTELSTILIGADQVDGDKYSFTKCIAFQQFHMCIVLL